MWLTHPCRPMLHQLVYNPSHWQVLWGAGLIIEGGAQFPPTLVPTTRFLTPSIHFEPEFIQLDMVDTTELAEEKHLL